MIGQRSTLKKQATPQKKQSAVNRTKNTQKKNMIKKSLTTSSIESITPKNISSQKANNHQVGTDKNQEIKKAHINKNNSQANVKPEILDNQINQIENENDQNIQSTACSDEVFDKEFKGPIDPNLVKQKYKHLLTEYEMTEIDDYPDVYFIGNSIKKKNSGSSFDQDETFQYKVKIGDHLAYRYEIISILGKGNFGTVYKCIDHKTKEKVAIKVLINTPAMHQQGRIEVENMKLLSSKAASSETNQNDQIHSPSKLRRISSSGINSNKSQTDEANPNSKHVVKMIDNFIFRNHICIVMEILGESLSDFMIRRTKSKPACLQNHPNSENDQLEPLPAQMVKLIAYQIMEGLALIHRKRIIHGNLCPENILLANPQTEESSKKMADSNSNENSTDNNNSIKDSYSFSIDYQKPQKITSHFTVCFSAIDNFTFMSQIKIIDFSSSCKQSEIIFSNIQNKSYAAPEIVFGSSNGPSADVWSAGCIIAELFVGKPLFPAKNDTDLMFRFIETLGVPPKNVVQLQSEPLKTSKGNKKQTVQKVKFFGDDGRLLNVSRQPVPMKTRLTSFLRSSDTMMIDFLSKCLEWDKSKRLSAAKLIKHPWIAGIAKQKI